ncbi:hypothetical protein [Massilia timonae]|uniref:Uncharacterized protein n=1 Tax=Massilia timonae CCUG 45783 TaxID=883126 RepID=K9DY99_9BURK|nr:hypothetical protein [Massilia timonae]EKU83617.1 hypothetical protein HMPREF9710_01102 [Massilia timonae CCUG 45783]
MSTQVSRFKRTAITSAVVTPLACHAHADQLASDGQGARMEAGLQRVVIRACGRSEAEQSVAMSVKTFLARAFAQPALARACLAGLRDKA